MLKEFKEFAFKGNLVDMAVGIIIGGAFATVVKSLVANIFMPPLGMLMSGVDFTELKFILKEGQAAVEAAEGVEAVAAVEAISINWGLFINDIIAFTLMVFAIFIVVKKVLTAMKKQEAEAPEEVSEPTNEVVLLSEIRDLLTKQNS